MMSSQVAPVCLFVYNRPEHTRRTVEKLLSNTLSDKTILYIFSDGAKSKKERGNVEKVRQYVHSISGFKEINIKISQKNKGLASSIIDGVTEVIKEHGRVIVIEDDLVTSPYTLKYLNSGLDYYETNDKVISVTAYNYPARTISLSEEDTQHDNYFSHRPCSWAWATWKKQWDSVIWDGQIFDEYLSNRTLQEQFKSKVGSDIDRMLKKQLSGKIDSWAVRFTYNAFRQNKLASYATASFVSNIGSDGSGTHKGLNDDYVSVTKLSRKSEYTFISEPYFNERIFKEFNRFVKKRYYFRRLVRIILGWFD